MLIFSLVNGLVIGSIYVLVALGLALVFGIMRIVNFAHGSILMVGAYAFYYFFQVWHQNYFLGLIVAFIASGIIGVAIQRGIFNPIRSHVLSVLLVAVGLSAGMEQASMLIFGMHDRTIHSVFSGPVISFFGMKYPLERLAIAGIGIALVAAFIAIIYRTKMGLAMRAVAQDEEAAALQGVSIHKIYTLGMFVGSGVAGLAGALVGPLFSISFHMGTGYLIKGFIIIILGGLGSIPGAIVGGLILGLVDSFGQTLIGSGAQAISFLIVMAMLIWKPGGLLGKD